MRHSLPSLLPALLSCCVLFSACGTGSPKESEDVSNPIVFNGLMLRENSVLITEAAESLSAGDLITLTFPQDLPSPAAGSLVTYTIDPAIRESYPPQATVLAVEEIELYAGHTVISFPAAESILTHLPRNTFLVDVRTPEEYSAGHVSGALNIPLQVIESEISLAIPETSDIVILYCRSGNRSAQAGAILETLGYQVILDAGGIMDYSGEQVRGSEAGPLPGSP